MKILHTADWHLGKPFARIQDDHKRVLVQQERFNVLARIGHLAGLHNVGCILVAGDLFDTPSVTRSTVSAACAAIGEMGRPVFVIPGNHDHGGPGCIWEQPFFLDEKAKLAPNLTVLLKPEPVILEDLVLFPCPLLRRHESIDPTAWIRRLDVAQMDHGLKPRVILLHGSVQGFGVQEDNDEVGAGEPNLVRLDQIPVNEFDYIAMGDWHGSKQVSPKAWYSGTPELDRFPKGQDNNPGHILITEIARGAEPRVEMIPTANFGWHQLDYHFTDDQETENFDAKLLEMVQGRTGKDLIRMELNGSLGIGATTRLESHLETWQARLLHMRLNNKVIVAPTVGELEELTLRQEDPLIARVASKLVKMSSGEGEDALVARCALRELHAACLRK